MSAFDNDCFGTKDTKLAVTELIGLMQKTSSKKYGSGQI